MKKNGEEIAWNVNNHVSSATNLPEEQMERSLHTFDKTQIFPGEPRDREHESLEIFQIYLRNLKSCGRKKPRRCISQELGR